MAAKEVQEKVEMGVPGDLVGPVVQVDQVALVAR
jgi:hypothetical protein